MQPSEPVNLVNEDAALAMVMLRLETLMVDEVIQTEVNGSIPVDEFLAVEVPEGDVVTPELRLSGFVVVTALPGGAWLE